MTKWCDNAGGCLTIREMGAPSLFTGVRRFAGAFYRQNGDKKFCGGM